ncbi:hypothetical protein BC833DRAFT_651837 [Globomyces pollinis-pini]|nr:hypothetical protein BC833DRAFT_651837 [Globomyces pollinis-pini]
MKEQIRKNACCAKKSRGKTTSENFVGADRAPSYAPHSLIEPTHIDLELDFDLDKKQVKTICTQTFKNNRTESNPSDSNLLKKIHLNALNFIDVKVEGEGVDYWYDGEILQLIWAVPFQPLESRTIKISYSIIEPLGGLYFNLPDQNYPNRAKYVVSDHETERARYWIPCVDFPAVRTTLSFTIHAPENYVAVANGAFVSEKVTDGVKTTCYQLALLCPSYLISIGVGEFDTADDEPVDGMPIKYLAPKDCSIEYMKQNLSKTPDMVRWIQKKLDYKFPWPKYYQIASKYAGGAMENISLVAWDEFVTEKPHVRLSYAIDETNIHEMAHTYFGDLLVVRHFEHVWLKESWATYIESVWTQENVGQTEYEYNLHLNKVSYIHETKDYIRPFVTRKYKSSWAMFDLHTYPGGAARLDMLRKYVGEDCFWKGVQNYIKAYAHKNVETDQFRAEIEKTSGLNLVKFFDQWFYSPGFPTLKGNFDYEAGSPFCTITLEQTQINVKENIPFFDIDVEVEVTSADDTVHLETIRFNDPSKTKLFAVFPLGTSKPKMVRIDPNAKLLFTIDFNPGEKILQETAKGAKDVSNRIRSYEKLIEVGSYNAVDLATKAIADESFYGVRSRVYRALSNLKTKQAIDFLAQQLLVEKHDNSFFSLLNFCKFKSTNVRSSLLKVLERTDLEYNARAKALERLAFQRHSDDLIMFKELVKDDSQIGPHSFYRDAAYYALGVSRDAESFTYLLSRLPRGVELESCTWSLLNAIEQSYLYQTKERQREAVELIEEYLQDDSQSVKMMAVNTLVHLKSTKSADVISSIKPTLEERPATELTEQLQTLFKSSDDFSPSKMLTLISELDTKVKELQYQKDIVDVKVESLQEELGKLKDSKSTESDSKVKADSTKINIILKKQ